MIISELTHFAAIRRLTVMALFAGIILPGAIGCWSSSKPPADPAVSTDGGQVLRVVATHSILGEWVETVGGDRIQVTTLVGPGGDAHTYEPNSRDALAISRANVIFENGLGFETWLDDLYSSSGSTAQRVVVTHRIKARALTPSAGVMEYDPHVWHSPRLGVEMLHAVADALSKADSKHALEYRQRANEYIEALKSLDRWISEQVTILPAARRQLFTTHDTFGYFAEDYGFEVHSVLGSISSEVADPSAAQVAAIIQRIRESEVPAVFSENILNPKLTEQVAREAGVSLIPSLYTDALGSPESPGASYLEMMRYNVTTMVEALR